MFSGLVEKIQVTGSKVNWGSTLATHRCSPPLSLVDSHRETARSRRVYLSVWRHFEVQPGNVTVLADTAIRGQDSTKREPWKRNVRLKSTLAALRRRRLRSGVCGTGQSDRAAGVIELTKKAM